MDRDFLREIATDYLLPFFTGAELDQSYVSSTPREKLVALIDPCTIHFKARKRDNYRLILKRSQKFDERSNHRVTELDVVGAFVNVINKIDDDILGRFKDELLTTFHRRVVARAVANRDTSSALLQSIDQLTLWATRLYEGKPISSSIGFDPSAADTGITLHELCQHDFGAVLSNGYDTIMTCDSSGNFTGHTSLAQTSSAPSFAPYRHASIAAWANDNRIAVALNRLAEILIFKDQDLVFARRSGKWHFLTHEPALTQMAYPRDHSIRKAIYESCLDASFARTGACIGIVLSSKMSQWKKIATSEEDHLDIQKSTKAKAIQKIIGTRKFQDLERSLRQELLAIDGATLVDYQGTILAVGAILRISGGSTGGGRLAAAKALSKLGLGIKVSQDGSIKGYKDGKNHPAFSVM